MLAYLHIFVRCWQYLPTLPDANKCYAHSLWMLAQLPNLVGWWHNCPSLSDAGNCYVKPCWTLAPWAYCATLHWVTWHLKTCSLPNHARHRVVTQCLVLVRSSWLLLCRPPWPRRLEKHFNYMFKHTLKLACIQARRSRLYSHANFSKKLVTSKPRCPAQRLSFLHE